MESSTRNYEFEMSMMGESIDSTKKIVLTLDKDCESIDSTKYRGMIDPKLSHLEAVKRIFRKMSNSEGSVNKREMEESSKKLKRKFKTMKGYECDERIMFEFILKGFTEIENTTHMMNALKKVRMESREMLLSIHHSLKMLLDIVSKLNMKLEDEKSTNGELTHVGLEHAYMFIACVVLCMLVSRCSQEHLKGDALDPWIPALEQGEQQSRGSMYNGGEGKQNKKMLMIGKRKQLRKQKAIAYMGVAKLCKAHKVKIMFKLHQITRARS
ncbi:hypothetical protein Tco_1473838 [Tanacetum coccineum]